mgnify:CR=1 FL=1
MSNTVSYTVEVKLYGLLPQGLAFALMVVMAQIHPDNLRRWSPWLFGLGIAMLVAVILFEGGLVLRFRDLRDAGPAVIRLVLVGGPIAWRWPGGWSTATIPPARTMRVRLQPSAQVTIEPTENQCDWTATPICPVVASRATIE